MSVVDATLSLISTIIGGGIVGLPYAFYYLGIPFGIFTLILVGFLTHRSCLMYLRTKDILPGNQESLYEVGFMILGVKSIYAIAGIISCASVGLIMIYLIVFGEIVGTVVADIFFGGKENNWLTTK